MVRALMEYAAVQRTVEHAAGVLHCALHLVEHDAFEHETTIAVPLQAVAFLEEVVPAQTGEEHGVKIYLRWES
jgi:hypothetical protein